MPNREGHRSGEWILGPSPAPVTAGVSKLGPAARSRAHRMEHDVVMILRFPLFPDTPVMKRFVCALFSLSVLIGSGYAEDSGDSGAATSSAVVRASIDDDGPGWVSLGQEDFAKVNSDDSTWSWNDGVLHCTGEPLSVIRTAEKFKNVEIVVEWMHEKPAGNSGLFVWVTPESIETLTESGAPGLPNGIEVQMLDHAFTEMMKAKGRTTDWFGTNGDVFAVGVELEPFPPLSPDGSRSFPRKHLCNGAGTWNHYYVRAINGELRLWVNGEEVSGGTNAKPAQGYLCLESEGSPIQFRKIRVRRLP